MKLILIAALLVSAAAPAAKGLVRGYSLTEWDKKKYDAAQDPKDEAGKTEAQRVVDQLYDLGVRQINLSPRAVMTDPWKAEVVPMTPPGEQRDERARYLRLIRYIKSKGMAVGIRPIFFVVDNAGKTPYTEEIPVAFADPIKSAHATLMKLVTEPAQVGNVAPVVEGLVDKAILALEPAGAQPREATRGETWLIKRAKGVKTRVANLPKLAGAELLTETTRILNRMVLIANKRDWWHGNVEPEDVNRWFESFTQYLNLYLPIAKIGNVDEFTIGAELYSMTVGIEDTWDEQPYGFPQNWLKVLNYVKERLPRTCRIMYDINFTDDKVEAGGLDQHGGEFLRWKIRLVDFKEKAKTPQDKIIYESYVKLWKGLDAVGIDNYRSLATKQTAIPANYAALVKTLQQTSDRYVSQIELALLEIENTEAEVDGKVVPIGRKDVILKELGFRSVTKSFIDPFVYAGNRGELNLEHQAAAYEATFKSFWNENLDWFKGIVFWDASIDLTKQGPEDLGFSPIRKPPVEKVLRTYFKD